MICGECFWFNVCASKHAKKADDTRCVSDPTSFEPADKFGYADHPRDRWRLLEVLESLDHEVIVSEDVFAFRQFERFARRAEYFRFRAGKIEVVGA